MITKVIAACTAVSALSVAMIIDSTAWHIRALALSEERGVFISKTNIFLYGGRFFSLLYMTSLAYLVDIGGKAVELITVSALGFSISSAANHFVLGKRNNRKWFVETAAKALRLPPRKCNIDAQFFNVVSRSTLNNRLFILSSSATLIFSMGISIPYVVASVFPEYRMTFNNLGQIINSIGMLMVLLAIDNKMYRDWDNGEIHESNEYYTSSRTVGLLLAAAIYWLSSAIIELSA